MSKKAEEKKKAFTLFPKCVQLVQHLQHIETEELNKKYLSPPGSSVDL